ncbi:MAG TPA: hypothetical protein ENI64_05875 [Gammaproteobacteria bacterium]|nr:hypothetical protein [Gammaproteobacteria bacterium]
MKEIILKTITIFLFLYSSNSASVTNALENGNIYLSNCTNYLGFLNQEIKAVEVDLTAEAHCMGYANGFIDGLMSTEMFLKDTSTKLHICIPNQADQYQVYRVAMKYMKENPSKLHQYIGVIFDNALSQAFPCSEKKSK